MVSGNRVLSHTCLYVCSDSYTDESRQDAQQLHYEAISLKNIHIDSHIDRHFLVTDTTFHHFMSLCQACLLRKVIDCSLIPCEQIEQHSEAGMDTHHTHVMKHNSVQITITYIDTIYR